MSWSRVNRLLGLGLVVMLVGVGSAEGQTPDVRATGWLTDYQSARMQAKQTGKPMFLVFRCVP